MPKPTRLQKRHHRFYCRVSVPYELRAEIGRTEIVRSLKTGDYAQALRKLPQVSAEIEAEFEAARRRLRQGPVTSLDDHQVKQLALLWLHRVERRAQMAVPQEGDVSHAEAVEQLEDDLFILADPDHPEVDRGAQAEADRLLKETNVALDRGSREYRLLCALLVRAMVESTRRAGDRLRADHAGRHHDPLFAGVTAETNLPPPSLAARLTLAVLMDEFMDEPEQHAVTEKTRALRRGMLKTLKNILGADTPVAEVTRQDAKRVRGTLLALPPNSMKRWPDMGPEQAAAMARDRGLPPMSDTMVNTYLGLYAGLFRHAVREHGLGANVFEGLRVRGSRAGAAKKRRSFTEDELRKLAESPPPGSLGLVLMVGLYNGLRLSEVLGLLPEDVREVGGVLCIDVCEREDRTLKTRSSARLVPAHPAVAPILKALMEQAGADPFSDLPAERRAAYASQKLNRHLRRLGMSDPKLVGHSARHTFRDALREVGVSRDAVLRLGGWSGGGSTADIYGSGASPGSLLRELKMVRYPVNLSTLAPEAVRNAAAAS